MYRKGSSHGMRWVFGKQISCCESEENEIDGNDMIMRSQSGIVRAVGIAEQVDGYVEFHNVDWVSRGESQDVGVHDGDLSSGGYGVCGGVTIYNGGLKHYHVEKNIKIVQFVFRVGSFDIDDLILNMCGATIGFGIWKSKLGQKVYSYVFE